MPETELLIRPKYELGKSYLYHNYDAEWGRNFPQLILLIGAHYCSDLWWYNVAGWDDRSLCQEALDKYIIK